MVRQIPFSLALIPEFQNGRIIVGELMYKVTELLWLKVKCEITLKIYMDYPEFSKL